VKRAETFVCDYAVIAFRLRCNRKPFTS